MASNTSSISTSGKQIFAVGDRVVLEALNPPVAPVPVASVPVASVKGLSLRTVAAVSVVPLLKNPSAAPVTPPQSANLIMLNGLKHVAATYSGSAVQSFLRDFAANQKRTRLQLTSNEVNTIWESLLVNTRAHASSYNTELVESLIQILRRLPGFVGAQRPSGVASRVVHFVLTLWAQAGWLNRAPPRELLDFIQGSLDVKNPQTLESLESSLLPSLLRHHKGMDSHTLVRCVLLFPQPLVGQPGLTASLSVAIFRSLGHILETRPKSVPMGDVSQLFRALADRTTESWPVVGRITAMEGSVSIFPSEHQVIARTIRLLVERNLIPLIASDMFAIEQVLSWLFIYQRRRPENLGTNFGEREATQQACESPQLGYECVSMINGLWRRRHGIDSRIATALGGHFSRLAAAARPVVPTVAFADEEVSVLEYVNLPT